MKKRDNYFKIWTFYSPLVTRLRPSQTRWKGDVFLKRKKYDKAFKVAAVQQVIR